MAEATRIVIVGGGVTGLCAAHYLSQDFGAEQVLLVEASDRLGGQTATSQINGFSCDWGPNGFLDREPLTLEWVADLGIERHLVRANEASAHRFILRDGRLVEVPLSPPAFIKSPLLSLSGRLRVLCEPLMAQRIDPVPESLWQFAARRIGKEAADYMVDPMASGIFGGDSKQLALAHCFPRMAEMEAEYGSLFKAMMAKRKQNKNVSAAGPAGTLTSFTAGIGYLPDFAGSKLGSRARTGTRVLELQPHNGGYQLTTEKGSTIEAQAVVIALPSYAASAITTRFDSDLCEALGTIPYANIVVLCTGYRREKVAHHLNGFGFVVPRNQKKRVLGCIWTSSVFGDRAPDGWVQLRTMYGGFTDQSVIELSDRQLLDLLRDEVESILGIHGGPEFVQIYRWPRGIPQYTLDHGRRMDRIEAAEARYPGLVFAGNAYRGVGLNDCVLSAHRAMKRVRGAVGAAAAN